MKTISPADDAPGRRRDQPHDAERADRLAAARLAHERHRLALLDVPRHAVHRAHDSRLGVELGAETPDVEEDLHIRRRVYHTARGGQRERSGARSSTPGRAVRNVSQSCTWPVSSPRRNQPDALAGRAVGPGLGRDAAAGLLLDAVVADRGGGAQGLLDVAFLEQPALVGGVRPDTRQAVGLQLEAHRQRVGAIGPALLPADLLGDAQEVLHVVADLVGEHVGLGEVAGRPEAVLQLVVEAQVDVDLPVLGAVEGPIAASAAPQPERTASVKSTSLARS